MAKSRRTKALDISPAVKAAVYERDGGRCVLCGRPGLPNGHFIPRSQSGSGIEENVITLCIKCHNRYDNGAGRAAIETELEAYLRSLYPEWSREKLLYRKEDYI